MTRLRLNWRVKSAVLSLTPILAVLILGFVNLSTPQISDPTTPAAAAQQLSASQASPSEDFHSFTVSVQKNTEPTAPQPSTVTTTITTSQASQATSTPQALPTPTPIPSICPANPLDHVYTPSRLQLINPCLTVTGRIESIHPEFDGDFHIGLRLDPQFTNLVNDCNRTCLFGLEKGRLIVEV